MKDFMFIFHNGPMTTPPTPEEMQTNMQQWMDWIDQLKAKNIYVSGEALHPGGKMVKGAKKPLVTDGPFAESKEIVGGFFVVKAASLEEASEIAKAGYPDFAAGGGVEVREVMVF
jgi:hypothetical protein